MARETKTEPERIEIKVKVQADVWIGRLSAVLKAVDEMDQDERRAAFAFLKSRFSVEWPSDPY